ECSFASKFPLCTGSPSSACSRMLFSAVLLIPPLPTISAKISILFILFSHHPRTARASSQHQGDLSLLCDYTMPYLYPLYRLFCSRRCCWRIPQDKLMSCYQHLDHRVPPRIFSALEDVF